MYLEKIKKSLNSIPGIKTRIQKIYDDGRINIWFTCNKEYSNSMIIIGRIMSRNYGGFQNYIINSPDITQTDDDYIHDGGWKCILDYTDVPDNILNGDILFRLDSGMYKGEIAINQSKILADNIISHLNDKKFCDMFGITELIRESKIYNILYD